MPVLLHLIRPTTHKLAARMLLNLWSPEYSQKRSTCYLRGQKVFALLVRYLPRVLSCQKAWITLSHVLVFVTAPLEEPVLRFVLAHLLIYVRNVVRYMSRSSCNNTFYKLGSATYWIWNFILYILRFLQGNLLSKTQSTAVYSQSNQKNNNSTRGEIIFSNHEEPVRSTGFLHLLLFLLL